MMATIEACKIRDGQPFKKPGQRKWRIAAKVFSLSASETKDGKPGVLVYMPDCSQIELGKNELVETP